MMMLNLIPYPNDVRVNGLKVRLDESKISFCVDESIPAEGYSLKVGTDGAKIAFSDEDGRYYALLTLSQLMENGLVPECEINDAPRFHYRAFMLDSSRHFPSADEVKRFVRSAALFKFNYFHWHLSDDHGFRIESEEFPFLNKVGSFRDGIGFGNDKKGKYGGYYSKNEIKEIVELCDSLHIRVIPELDMPGHTVSWLAGYASLGCKKENISVETTAGVKYDVLCAGREETYDFCERLIDEVAELFPCEYFHIGGDEVPKDNWKNCPDCQRKIKEEGLKNETQLQDYFTRRISAHLKAIGKKPIVWNDALGSVDFVDDVVVASWNDPMNKVASFANKGGKVIAENTPHMYLDYSYSMISLKKAYSFGVFPIGLKKEARENYLGVEAPLWSEWIENFDRLSYQAYPRLMAVAEVGWTEAEKKNYEAFRARIHAYSEKLGEFGIMLADESHWDPSPSMRIKLDKEWNSHFH